MAQDSYANEGGHATIIWCNIQGAALIPTGFGLCWDSENGKA